MGSWSLRLGFGVPVLAAWALTQVGCAEERKPINQVQANALAKSFFIGSDLQSPDDDPEFYTNATVIDVPYGLDAAQVFPGLTGGVKRIKWEVTEHQLVARQTYEDIEGVDRHGVGAATRNGKVIAAYHIEKHFDIKRAYNSSTGEELNVITENSSDRAWYDRDYFRVDWSSSMVTSSYNWDPLLLYNALSDGVSVEPLSYYVSDPSHPDAPHFEADQGYFDITNKVFYQPATITIDGQTLPACFYRGSIVVGATAPWGQCEASEVTYRMSFKKVPKAGDADFTDYEPRHWDGARMNGFGIFTTDRLGYDEQTGITDDLWYRFAQRYNLWKASHTEVACAGTATKAAGLEPGRDDNRDGTDDECEAAGVGSRCDNFVGKCTIPYAKRELRPVPWYYTLDDGDDVIFEATQRATWEWDAAFRIGVMAARLVECRRTGKGSLAGSPFASAQTCEEFFGWDQRDDVEANLVENHMRCKLANGAEACQDKVKSNVTAHTPMVVLCHSPVVAEDDPACGPVGKVVRVGDIRHHQVNVWPTRQSLSPWGYGPSGSDPLTGEILAASINVYDAITDSAAKSFVDQLQWLNGELKNEDIISADYVRGWADTPSSQAPGSALRMQPEEIDSRLGGMSNALKSTDPARNKILREELKRKINFEQLSKQVMRDLDIGRMPSTVGGTANAEFEARINMAKGTPVEAALMGPMWTQLAGTGEIAQRDYEAALDISSPIRGMRSKIIEQGTQALQVKLGQIGQCILQAPEPTGLPALAKAMNEKFPPVEDDASPAERKGRTLRMWDYLRANMHYSVILHEMGHTVGQRHNFVGSYDKLNYRPQYWQLRTKGNTVNTPCTGPSADGEDCVGPRYYDPLTEEENDNAIWMWQHSTVMDYPGDLTQDMLGLGVYDYASVRMFYADVMDVWADGVIVKDTQEGDQLIDLIDRAGGITGQWVFRDANTSLHYTQWNEFFGGLIRNCRQVGANPDEDADRNMVRPDWWDDDKYGIWHPVFDGHVVRNEVCDRPPVDFVSYRDMQGDSLSDYLNSDPKYFTPRRTHDDQGRPRMPYGFESDEYADGWSPSTYRHDNGADLYEELLFHSNLYEDRHVFDSFRNNRTNFTVYGGYLRALSRYHGKIANLGQGYSLLHDFYWKEIARNAGVSTQYLIDLYEAEGGPLRDHAIAATLAFDHFVRVLTRPHVGPHFRTQLNPLVRPTEDVIGYQSRTTPPVINIPNGTSVANGDLMYGGRPINNQFQYGQGYWSSDYINQTGSYYEKAYAMEMLLSASYQSFNFFRFDGLDARFRHTNFTNLFPEGMRRLIGVLMTNDAEMFAPRLATRGGLIESTTDDEGRKWPSKPMGWASFVHPDGPQMCWPTNGLLTCSDIAGDSLGAGAPAESVAIDPQLGYEIQKFIGFWSYVYLPGRQNYDWVDMMRIYQVGGTSNPDYLPEQSIEWRDPVSGLRYVARSYGDEQIFGKTWDKGVAAKMLQWANTLTEKAYETDDVTPVDPVTGRVNVKLDADGNAMVKTDINRTPSDPNNLTCDDNSYCTQLREYRGLIDYMRTTAAYLGFPEPALQIFGGD